MTNTISLDENYSTTRVITHQEPDMKNNLSWLDADVADDRIIASTLEIMINHPTARIVLVTRDINLQNKAEVALIEFVESPEI